MLEMRILAAFMSRWRICDCLLLALVFPDEIKVLTNVVKVSQAFQELLHVALDL